MERALLLILLCLFPILNSGEVKVLKERTNQDKPLQQQQKEVERENSDLHLLHTTNNDLDILSPRQLQSHHPVNRSDVHLGLDSNVLNCYQDEDVHVVVRYTFNYLDPSLFDHDLILTLKNSYYVPLIEQNYLLNELNLFSLPINEFQVGGEKVFLTLFDNTTQKTLDEQTLRFVNPCFHRPTAFQRYFLIPLTDNPIAVLAGGIALAGKLAADQYFKQPPTPPPQTITLPTSQSSSSSSGKSDEQTLTLMKKYLKRLTTHANPSVPITYPAPKLLPNPPVTSLPAASIPVVQPPVQPIVHDIPSVMPVAPTTTITTPIQGAAALGQQTIQRLASSQLLLRVLGLVGGLAFFLSQALKPFNSNNIVRTRPVITPLTTLTTLTAPEQPQQQPLAIPQSSLFSGLAKNLFQPLWRDMNHLFKAVIHPENKEDWDKFRSKAMTLLPSPEQMDEMNKNPKVIVTKKLWKTILVTVLQTSLYLLKKWKFNNSPKFIQHAGANDLPF